MKTIGIIGLGLIGGSLARALRHKSPETIIIAHNKTEKTLKEALSEGIIDHAAKKIDETFSACEIIFICTPVSEIEHIAELLKKFTTKNTIVTDVGSTKEDICQTLSAHADSFTFIGGHPMAGSERSGFNASNHYLFENAFYLLTPYQHTPSDKTNELLDIISLTGAIPLIISPKEHDFIAGAISHTPHVIAMSLVNAVSRACTNTGSAENALALASGGFKDITRIASSNPKMWNDISLQNRQNILKLLEIFKETLTQYEQSLQAGQSAEILGMFQHAKDFRDKFSTARPNRNQNIIGVDLEDKPGGIAFIATILAYNGINIKNIGIINNRDFESGILEIVVENEADKQKGIEILSKNGILVRS